MSWLGLTQTNPSDIVFSSFQQAMHWDTVAERGMPCSLRIIVYCVCMLYFGQRDPYGLQPNQFLQLHIKGKSQLMGQSQIFGHSLLVFFLKKKNPFDTYFWLLSPWYSQMNFSNKAGPSGNLSLASAGNAGLKSGASLFLQMEWLDCTAVNL